MKQKGKVINYHKERFFNPKTKKYETKIVETRTTRINKGPKGRTAFERELSMIKSDSQRAKLIQQKHKQDLTLGLTSGAEATGTTMTGLLNNKSAENVQVSNSASMNQNINGGVKETTNQRDDDDESSTGGYRDDPAVI